jgi:uncharacterized membrane protein YphA (DoxX/SURF4 family)
MKTIKLGYWIPTVLLALALLGGGISQLSGAPEVAASMAHLGYPPYMSTLIGIWKVLGALAILAPGLPRLKEWAYAGIFFNMTGATFSHLASGDSLGESIIPLVLAGIALVSWSLRPESRRLKG